MTERDVIITLLVDKAVDMLNATGRCSYGKLLTEVGLSFGWQSKIAWSDIKIMIEEDMGLTERTELIPVTRDYFAWLDGTRTFAGVKRDPSLDPGWFMVLGGRGKKPDGLITVDTARPEMLEHLGLTKGNRVRGHVKGAYRLENTMEQKGLPALQNGSARRIAGIVRQIYNSGDEQQIEQAEQVQLPSSEE
jgi:hypothetical protein